MSKYKKRKIRRDPHRPPVPLFPEEARQGQSEQAMATHEDDTTTSGLPLIQPSEPAGIRLNSFPGYYQYYVSDTGHATLPEINTFINDMTMNVNGETRPRRMPNFVQIAQPYIFQQHIDKALKELGVAQAREDNLRLAGVRWIDDVRRASKLPVRTFDTAVVYYHRFRLVHADGEYSFTDAAAAALFTACKIEDTLRKSRDIICAAHNVRAAEKLTPDDSMFEQPSRNVIGLERLMLEASSFDFRNRHPQHLLIKLAKHYGLSRDSPIVKTAWTMSLDIYRTFAPLKQSTATLALACLELSIRLHSANPPSSEPPQTNGHTSDPSSTPSPLLRRFQNDYTRYHITRAMITETLLDLLDLYTSYRAQTDTGSHFPLDTFLQVRIPLNEELSQSRIPRYTEFHDPQDTSRHRNGQDLHNHVDDAGRGARGGRGMPNGVTRGARGARGGVNGAHHPHHGRGNSRGGGAASTVSPKETFTSPGTNSSNASGGSASTAPTSAPGSAAAPSTATAGGSGERGGIRQRVGERGRDGTVRFMLDPDEERREKRVAMEYAGVGDGG